MDYGGGRIRRVATNTFLMGGGGVGGGGGGGVGWGGIIFVITENHVAVLIRL